MKYLYIAISFLFIGCQSVDPIVVPIDQTIRDINHSSTLYENNTTHTKMGFESNALVWRKEF